MSPMGCTGSLGVITVVATSIAAGSTRFSARGGAGPAGYFEATLAPQPIQADRERTVQLSLYSVSSLQSVESPTHAPATGQCRCLSPILPPALWFDAVESTGGTTGIFTAMSAPPEKREHILSDELLHSLVGRLEQLKNISSDPAKVDESIGHVKLTLRLRS